MIPKVRQWLVTASRTTNYAGLGTVERERYVVLAPTKYLARLNFRHEVGLFGIDIISIGVARKQRPRPAVHGLRPVSWPAPMTWLDK